MYSKLDSLIPTKQYTCLPLHAIGWKLLKCHELKSEWLQNSFMSFYILQS